MKPHPDSEQQCKKIHPVIKKIRGVKNVKITKIAQNVVKGSVTNISLFRTARVNNILGGHDDEKHGEEMCPNGTVPDATYQTAVELHGSRGLGTSLDELRRNE